MKEVQIKLYRGAALSSGHPCTRGICSINTLLVVHTNSVSREGLWPYLSKLEVNILFDPEVPLLGICLEDILSQETMTLIRTLTMESEAALYILIGG